MGLLLSYGSEGSQSLRGSGGKPSRMAGWSLNTKICVAATALVVASLAITATVIGVKSSATAEEATMELART